MATWAEFEHAAPELAAAGWGLLARGGRGSAFLATVRGDAPPRIHPITIGLVEGRLVAFLLGSAKRTDLETDGRYALHAHQDRAVPDEFSVRGRAHTVDKAVRDRVARDWFFEVDDDYDLFEFDVEQAILGRRPSADDWPPRYTSWKA